MSKNKNDDKKGKNSFFSRFDKKEVESDELMISDDGQLIVDKSKGDKRKRTIEDDASEIGGKQREYEEYFPDIAIGLNSSQIENRVAQGLINKEQKVNSRSYLDILKDNILTFFNFLAAIIATALVYVGSIEDLLFLVIIVSNLTIGILQEIRSKRKLDKLKLMTAPIARVLRNGKFENISVNKLVISDIVELVSGKQISSDSVVISGELEVNESLLTGESIPILKKNGDKIFAGSYVVSGKALTKVVTVGEDNYISKLSMAAKKYKKPNSELLTSLNAIIKTVGIIILPLGAVMLYNNYVSSNQDIFETVTKTSGALIGMIPAGLFLLTSVSLALGSMKIASNNALVQESYAIEMLARVDMLCLDKTGTITDGTMVVCSVEELAESKTPINDIMSSMMYSLNDNNQTAIALKNYFPANEVINTKKAYPFSSERKYSAVQFEDNNTYFVGAPEFLYRKKDNELDGKIYNYSAQGYRVLMVARTSQDCGGIIPDNVTPLALIVIQDRIREDAPSILKYFKEQGVKIKIISGDNPITVAEVARRAGVEGTDKHISLDGISSKELFSIAQDYTVFGRVSPEQKLLLVRILKKQGHTVAMTGDGVNDILAMKESDCSIAMASGSDAARNVAHLVLMDSNFGSMPTVVGEGRRVINNIQRTASLFLVKTIMSVLLSIFTIVLKIPYPFSPKQLLLFEFFVTGVPAFFLALEPTREKISGNFIFNVLQRALPGALVAVFNILILNFTRDIFGLSQNDIVTMSVILTTFVGFTVLNDICKPYNAMRVVLIFTMSVSALGLVTFMPGFFSISQLSLQPYLIMLLLMSIANYLLRLFKTTVKGLANVIIMSKEIKDE